MVVHSAVMFHNSMVMAACGGSFRVSVEAWQRGRLSVTCGSRDVMWLSSCVKRVICCGPSGGVRIPPVYFRQQCSTMVYVCAICFLARFGGIGRTAIRPQPNNYPQRMNAYRYRLMCVGMWPGVVLWEEDGRLG